MGCGSKIREVIKSLDFFSARVGLRYDQEYDYQTFYGGLVTIIIIIVFFTIFADTVLNTIDRKDVISKETLYE